MIKVQQAQRVIKEIQDLKVLPAMQVILVPQVEQENKEIQAQQAQ